MFTQSMHERIAASESNEDVHAREETKAALSVIDLQYSMHVKKVQTRAGAITILAATSASGCMPRIRDALSSGHMSIADAIKKKVSFSNLSACEPLHGFTAEVQVSYRQRPLALLIFQSLSIICSSEVPFCGDALSHRDFAVSYPFPGDAPAINVLVVIQPPILSALEEELTRQAPVDLSEMDSHLFFESKPPLMVMDGGWATGAYLANIAAMKMRQEWHEQEPSKRGEPTPKAEKPSQADTPDMELDLSLPAEVLLDHYGKRLRKKS